MNIAIVIPARGGSKGIPRKALRPLAGLPLISYAIKSALDFKYKSKSKSNVFVSVSTDDDEVSLISNRFGAEVIVRDETLSGDLVTLDPVILHAIKKLEEKNDIDIDIVITVQPTSPLIISEDIDKAISIFQQDMDVETVISVVDDRSLRWAKKNNKYIPNYTKRLNRQELPEDFKETGAIIACRRELLDTGSRVGNNVRLLEIPFERSFDIDTVYDWYICENILNKRKIIFNVIGYPEVGLGHVYRALMLANEFVLHDIYFITTKKSKLAAEQIVKFNYKVIVVDEKDIVKTIGSLKPDLIVNDILDTDHNFISKLKSYGCKIINFEDLGQGRKLADLVINALYTDEEVTESFIKSGADYFCLRDEFLYTDIRKESSKVENILLTFGGTDEGNLTCRVLRIISDYCHEKLIAITIVTGPGYLHLQELKSLISSLKNRNIKLVLATKRISDFMLSADVAVTSGGRTVLELTSLAIPSLVICQNKRETTHSFANVENGILNLGYRNNVTDQDIFDKIKNVIENKSIKDEMIDKMLKLDLSKGKSRVVKLIQEFLN